MHAMLPMICNRKMEMKWHVLVKELMTCFLCWDGRYRAVKISPSHPELRSTLSEPTGDSGQTLKAGQVIDTIRIGPRDGALLGEESGSTTSYRAA